MVAEAMVAERARQLSASVYPRHEAVIHAIRMRRGEVSGEIPKLSDVVQEAIIELGRVSLPPDQFTELTGEAA